MRADEYEAMRKSEYGALTPQDLEGFKAEALLAFRDANVTNVESFGDIVEVEPLLLCEALKYLDNKTLVLCIFNNQALTNKVLSLNCMNIQQKEMLVEESNLVRKYISFNSE